MSDVSIQCTETVDRIGKNFETASAWVKKLLVGRHIEITGDFRDQPYGSSKPNMRGRVVKVRDAWIDTNGANGARLWVFGEGIDCGIPAQSWKLAKVER